MRFAEQWTWCSVAAVRDVTRDVREIVLRPDSDTIPPWPVGSHITTSLLIDGRPQTRSYSLVGDRSTETYKIAVRRAPDSRGGSLKMWALEAGARLQISSPATLFDIDWRRKSYCLIAGGIGITPMVGIASALARRAVDVRMHYAVKSRRDAAYLDDIAGILGERLTVHASDEGARLDLAAAIGDLPDDSVAIVCGPMRMLEAVRSAWSRTGRASADLRYETFGSSGLMPSVEFRVKLAETGEEIMVPRNRSMLAALSDAGYEVMSDCERGECGVCAINVVAIDGAIDHRDVFFSDHQKQSNVKICPCVSRAAGVVTVDTLYRPDHV